MATRTFEFTDEEIETVRRSLVIAQVSDKGMLEELYRIRMHDPNDEPTQVQVKNYENYSNKTNALYKKIIKGE